MAVSIPQPSKFYLFSKLPTEIRLQIWVLALDQPQPIEVILDNPSNNVSSELKSQLLSLQNPHPVLRTCYESFVASRRHFQPLHITPKNDTRKLEILVRVGSFILYLHPLNMVLHHSEICFRRAPVNILAVNYTRDSIAESVSIVRRFGSVHTLYVVLNDKWAFDSSEEGRALKFKPVDGSLGSLDVEEVDYIKVKFLQRMLEEVELYPESWSVPEIECVLVSRRTAGSRTKL